MMNSSGILALKSETDCMIAVNNDNPSTGMCACRQSASLWLELNGSGHSNLLQSAEDFHIFLLKYMDIEDN